MSSEEDIKATALRAVELAKEGMRREKAYLNWSAYYAGRAELECGCRYERRLVTRAGCTQHMPEVKSAVSNEASETEPDSLALSAAKHRQFMAQMRLHDAQERMRRAQELQQIAERDIESAREQIRWAQRECEHCEMDLIAVTP